MNHFNGAIYGNTFFITGDQESDTATVVGVDCNKALAGHNHGGQRTFHIRGATADYVTINNRCVKRRLLPVLLWSCGNYVGMSGKAEGWP